MSRFPTTLSAVTLLTTLAIAALMVAPASSLGISHGLSHPTVAPAHSLLAPAVPVAPAGSHPAAAVHAGSRIYQTLTTPLTGVQYSSRVAADNATQTIFSVSTYVPVLTAIDGMTGTALRHVEFGNGSTSWTLNDVAFDNRTNQVFVAIYTEGGSHPSFVAALNGTTFAFIANMTFTTSSDPLFIPYREYYEWNTNQLFVENETNQDVAAINVTSHTVALVIGVPCTGFAPSGCTSYFGMFEMNDTLSPLIILPANAATAWAIFPASNPVADTIVTGITVPSPNSTLGPGTFSPNFGAEYFENGTQDGTLFLFNQTGAFLGAAAHPATYPETIASDPGSLWLILTVFNISAGDTVYGVNPITGAYGWALSNLSLSASSYDTDLAFFRTPTANYTVTGGYGPSPLQLIKTSSTVTPFATVIGTLTAQPSLPFPLVAYPGHDLVVSMEFNPSEIIATTESTGATAWTWTPPGGLGGTWLDIDTADGILYVAVGATIYAVSASSGTLQATFVLSYSPSYIAYGFHHMLYAVDTTNETIQGYSNAGGAGSLTWAATITTPGGSAPCSLAASPVAEVVVALDCGHNSAIVGNATTGTIVATYPGSTSGYAAVFNSTGALYIGNDSVDGVAIYAAGTWAPLRSIPSPVPVEYLSFVDPLNAILVGGFGARPAALLGTASGTILAEFLPPTPLTGVTSDALGGTIDVGATDGQLLIGNLVPIPAAATGLTVKGGNTTLNVSWGAVTGSGSYPVTGYGLYTGASATGPWTSAGTASSTSATIIGLTDGTTYFVTVQALSGAGNGPNAAAVSGVPAGVPYPPSGVTLGSATSSSLVVTWTAPTVNDGAAVTGYTVLYATSSSGPWTSVAGGSGLTFTLSGLASGKTYYVQVEATNSVGTGHPSAAASGSTSSSSGSSGLGGLSGTTLAIIGIVVVVLIIAAIAGIMMMRRRSGPGGSGPSASGTPPPGAAGSGSPPPGAMDGSSSPPGGTPPTQ
ncbi:MAG: fibronectin type III domain-containing protein [Thermoplasmata archaeon]|nr:fibronectin type III domain-containing protein [Thermoplasmata archaeon]MCI4356724.1 fibronectin type III domain-containing protein [Thermoplasmata archaeon]